MRRNGLGSGASNSFPAGAVRLARKGGLLAAVLVLAAWLSPGRGLGAGTDWTVLAGDWADANNWSGGEPNSSVTANIDNGGTATITTPGAACYSLYLGSAAGQSGTVDLVSGSLYTPGASRPMIQLVFPPPDAPGQVVGLGGTGVFVHSDGNNVVRYGLWLGYSSGSSGTYLLSGNGNLSAGAEFVGWGGDGFFIQSGGRNATGALSIGHYGRYALTGGALDVNGVTPSTGVLAVGGRFLYMGPMPMSGSEAFDIAGGSTGSFVHTEGNVAISRELYVGYDSNAAGTYQLTGNGSLTVPTAYVGWKGAGTFTQTAGNHTISSSLSLGQSYGSSGTYDLSGNGCLGAQTEYVGVSGTGVFTHSDGNNRVSNYLWLGEKPGSSGTYHLSGNGRLTAGWQCVGWKGSGVFIQSGGHNDAGAALVIGRSDGGSGSYSMSSGSLATEWLGIHKGEFSISDSSASISVSLLLISGGRFSAVPGSVIRVKPPPSWAWWSGALYNNSFDANALAGMANLRLIFENGDGNDPTFEVAGKDLGATPDGFLCNFGLGTLQLGGPDGDGRVVLVDDRKNQRDTSGVEALYVQGLIVNPGSELWLNGIHLYVNGVLVNPGDGGLYGGGSICVPEPACVTLLALGAAALLGRRRRAPAGK